MAQKGRQTGSSAAGVRMSSKAMLASLPDRAASTQLSLGVSLGMSLCVCLCQPLGSKTRLQHKKVDLEISS